MYPVGHMALGYLSGKVASKILDVKVEIPLLFFASVIPDIDLLIPQLQHRGPTHSIVFSCLLLLPALVLFKKKAVPYFLALAQHVLIGDYLVGSTQILWPLSTKWYGLGCQAIPMASLTNIVLEWILFLVSITIMFKTKDAGLLFQHKLSNLTLLIPVLSVSLPTFLSFPLLVPMELIIPHLTYLTLFILSIVTYFATYVKAVLQYLNNNSLGCAQIEEEN